MKRLPWKRGCSFLRGELKRNEHILRWISLDLRQFSSDGLHRLRKVGSEGEDLRRRIKVRRAAGGNVLGDKR